VLQQPIPPGIISVASVTAPYPLMASWHQWDSKKEMKKETYMARELKNMSGQL